MRRPSEKITVRLYPGQVDYLLGLLAKQDVANARLIAMRLAEAAEQHEIKVSEFEAEEQAEWARQEAQEAAS